MGMGGSVILGAIFSLGIGKSFVKIAGLSDVNRFPFTGFGLPDERDIAGYFSKTGFYGMNPISMIPTGLTCPVDIRLADFCSPLIILL